MPCRALEAFRLSRMKGSVPDAPCFGLNALSGIGGVQTGAYKGMAFAAGTAVS